MNQNFANFMRDWSDKKLAVAVSGGADSVCLLHWAATLCPNLVCLHVNHGLRDAADQEQKYVRDLCRKLNVPCHVFHWRGDKPTSNVEDAARTARYDMMTEWCRENNIDALMTAHHADDQIETFLMNLARGSGLYGLAAMRPVSVRDGVVIIRPLLEIARADLQKYCDDNAIRYFTDEMNNDLRYTRARIRKNRHVMGEMLGISDARILLAIRNLGRARDGAAADIDARVRAVVDNNRAMFSESFLFDAGPDIGLRLLGTLIQQIGGARYQPRLNSLARAMEMLRGDCKFTLGRCTVRRLGNRILVVPEGTKTSFRKRNEKYKKTK